MSGPLISAKQLDRVAGFIEEGTSAKAPRWSPAAHRLDRKATSMHRPC